MELKQIIVGRLETNCYLLREDKRVLLVDPGAEASKILAHLHENDELVAILLTHGHWDHTEAIAEILDYFPTKVYLHYGDIDIFRESMDVEAIIAGDYQFGPFAIKVYETPGHSEGSVLYECGKYLFCGDTLFLEDIGRTDLHGGNYQKMRQSLSFIKTLNPSLIVLPGHEETSTLKHELQYNPHLKER